MKHKNRKFTLEEKAKTSTMIWGPHGPQVGNNRSYALRDSLSNKQQVMTNN
jgi:hypothetical protein